MPAYLYLAAAILAEVVATSALKAADGFTRLWPSLLVIAGYAAAFWFLTHVVRTVPVGIAYAVWSGMGVVLVALIAAVVYRQIPDLAAVLGMAMIVGGVVVIQLFSRSVGH